MENVSSPVTDFLAHDHDRLDGLLTAARGAIARGEREAATLRFGEFRTGLLRHIRMEEEVLFPAFERATDCGDGGPTAVLRLEHREIQNLLETMDLALARVSGAEWSRLEARLLEVLGDHNAKEEEIVYPLTDRTHAPSARAELIRRMESVEPAPPDAG